MSDSTRPRSFPVRHVLQLRGMSPARRLLELHRLGIAVPDKEGLLSHTTEALATAFDAMIENAIGAFPVPLGIATNFVMNGEPRLIAMATEERSVIAAASKAAKLAEDGITVTAGKASTRAQILYSGLPDPPAALAKLRQWRGHIEDLLRAECNPMAKYGGELRVEAPRFVPGDRDTLIIVEIDIGTADAMGANVVTRIAERAAERLLRLFTDRRPTAVICCNDEAGFPVAAEATFRVAGGAGQVRKVLDLQTWAAHDPPRAVTHNKGVMNAVSAIALATGQDTRAIEACVHASAAKSGGYKPLTTYAAVDDDRVRATLSLRLPIGTVGGATAHPTAAFCRKLMRVKDAADLACLMTAAGLAQNFAALLALSGEGIPGSHARLAKQRHP
ncbi:MAG TPA: 3-hydroxy-3-methylglutaryl-CoA reductase [Candidatus Eisenbacteria bacterium]|nr:3-hydroxy-3-methylglutaryl-CoA reductase [Candidatus Eisenbacteria bacterium]